MLDWTVAGGQEKSESADERCLPDFILLMAVCSDNASDVFPFSRAAEINSKQAEELRDPSFVDRMSSSTSPALATAKIFLARVPCAFIHDSIDSLLAVASCVKCLVSRGRFKRQMAISLTAMIQ